MAYSFLYEHPDKLIKPGAAEVGARSAGTAHVPSLARLAGATQQFWHRPYAPIPFPTLFRAGTRLIGCAYGSELPPFDLIFWRWVTCRCTSSALSASL